jgi:hypothetical protein
MLPRHWLWTAAVSIVLGAIPARAGDGPKLGVATASATAEGSAPAGAIDGDRFATEPAKLWYGKAGERTWWWKVRFPTERSVGAILQVVGDHELALRNVPRAYIWQSSRDGRSWTDLPETDVANERRIYRVHRLKKARLVRAMRILVREAGEGSTPAIRDVAFFDETKVPVPFTPWVVVVTTTGDKKVPGEGSAFVPLVRRCEGWAGTPAQNVWLGDFQPEFLTVEPRPVCAFLSGNFIDWCQQDRAHWRGVERVLQDGRLPIWASCGGAQGLAILAEHGSKSAWDCPHCRDLKAPRSPIYGHIGHTAKRPCGDYSGCVFERGLYNIVPTNDDPAFAGLPHEFRAVESHCGQIEWTPRGWELVATAGEGTLTKTQCVRLKGRPIYAAQFHIENAGAPDSSRTIMTNFLRMASEWNRLNDERTRSEPPGS